MRPGVGGVVSKWPTIGLSVLVIVVEIQRIATRSYVSVRTQLVVLPAFDTHRPEPFDVAVFTATTKTYYDQQQE